MSEDRRSSAIEAVRSTQNELTKLLADSKLVDSNHNKSKRFASSMLSTNSSGSGKGKLGSSSLSGRARLASSDSILSTSRKSRESKNERKAEFSDSVDQDEVKDAENVDESNLVFLRETKATIELNRRALEAEERIRELEYSLASSERSRDAAIERAVNLEKHSENLRDLITEAMRSGDLSRSDASRAEAFFKRLGPSLSSSKNSEALLRDSEPPASYASEAQSLSLQQYPNNCQGALFVKVDHIHATELEATKARLKQANAELDRLRNKLEEVCGKKSHAIMVRNEKLARAEQLVADKHTQVLGAVRRVHYLLEQNERQQADIGQKDGYIAKLETKLLELNRELNNYRAQGIKPKPTINSKNAKPLAPKPDYTRRRASTSSRGSGSKKSNASNTDQVNWNSVFEQGSLGRSPEANQRRERFGSSPRPGVDHPVSPRGTSKQSRDVLDSKRRESFGGRNSEMAQSQETRYSDAIDGTGSSSSSSSSASPRRKSSVSSPLDRQGNERILSTRSPSRFQQQIEAEISSPASSVSSLSSSMHDEWLSKIGASPI